MGTDIHPAVEVRRNGIWRYHRPTELCRWYAEVYTDPTDVKAVNTRMAAYYAKPGVQPSRHWKPVKLGDRKNPWDRCKYRLPEYVTQRHYRMYALLGNVRNGTGFAGVYTHDYIPFIQDNRGYPVDISREASAKMSMEHSAGWVTLDELKDYDYRIEFTEGGVLDEATFEAMCFGRTPSDWSGGISGQNIVVLEPDAYASLYESPIDLLQGKASKKGANYDTSKRYFIKARWPRNLYDEVKEIPKEMIPYLEKLVPKGGTDKDVRIVFDFDS
jgi:hypothetical protein